MDQDKPATIAVSDLNLIATLMACQQLPVSIDRSNPKRIQFLFPAATQSLIDQYWKKELLIEPQELANQLRNARARIFEGGAS